MNILNGTSVLMVIAPQNNNTIDSAAWKPNGRCLQSYRDVCGWHEKVGFDEMTYHRFLSSDRLVQESRFGSGYAVVVNFGDRPWEDPRGFSVPPRGYRTFKKGSER